MWLVIYFLAVCDQTITWCQHDLQKGLTSAEERMKQTVKNSGQTVKVIIVHIVRDAL